MKKAILTLLALALLVSLTACGGTVEARQGSGLRSGGSTVSQILESAGADEAPTDGAEPPQASSEAAALGQEVPPAQEGGIDIDLTQLNSTMIYSEVYNMMADPEAYVGKTVRLAGYCTSTYFEPTDTVYYAVLIPDAAACCAQGIEYRLPDGAAYPADDEYVVITGTFELYEELGMEYCRLGNAAMEA